MGKHYQHLSVDERERLAQMFYERRSMSCMAKALGRDKSTISRELKRNGTHKYRCYAPCRAHTRSVERRKKASRRPRLRDPLLQAYIRAGLREGWSPEIIAGRLPIDHPGRRISHEAIYQFVYDPHTSDRRDLIELLRRAHRKRKAKGIGRKIRKTKIPNRIPIEARPKVIDARTQYGHWEGDTLVSRRSLAALSSLTERKSRLLLLTKLEQKVADEMTRSVIERLAGLPAALRRTLTLDNGTENSQHEAVTREIGAKCYFARPYASWQRGTNEQINGLVRQYLPKGTDFRIVPEAEIAEIEARINNRPRKCLRFRTPREVFARVVALRG